MALLRIRITLEDVEPEVWRLVEIGGDRSLSEVHDAIQIAMGWTDSHLHLFEHPDGRRWSDPLLDDDDVSEGDERTVALAEVLGAGPVRYEYDFGDSWSHRLELVDATDGDTTRVSLINGARSAPPEDCGGAPGYADLLSAMADPGALDHELLTRWVSEPRLPWGDHEPFDPESLDIDAVNRRLRRRFDAAHVTGSWGTNLQEVVRRLPPGALTAFGDHLDRAELGCPVLFDADLAADAVRPFAWLLDHVADGGLKLTDTGRLPPASVRSASRELGWDRRWIGTMNREDHVPMAADLREWATKTALVRKYRGTLLLTRAGAAARRDPTVLLHQLASRALQVAPKGVSREAAVLLLVELAAGAEPDLAALSERVAFGLHMIGYAEEDRMSPPSAATASGLVSEVWGLLGMLGLVPGYVREPLPASRSALAGFARVALQEV